MYYLKEELIYNQISKEIVIKTQQDNATIFLNETASVIFKAIADGKDIKDEIIKKYALKNEELEIISADVQEVLNNLTELGVIHEG